jgi:hypothetical protein
MGRLGPYNNTTAPIACSVRAQTFTFSVLFEVPCSRGPMKYAARACVPKASFPGNHTMALPQAGKISVTTGSDLHFYWRASCRA